MISFSFPSLDLAFRQKNTPDQSFPSGSSRAARAVALIVSGLLAASWSANAAEIILLGAAEDFAVLGGSTVTNTGATVINGNVGVSPGTAITGFPPGVIVNGTFHTNDALATQAHADALTAYTQLLGEPVTMNLSGLDLGGQILTPGVYRFDDAAQLTGTLSLNTGGDPNAAFHFLIGTEMTIGSGSSVILLGLDGAPGDNVFWQVGSSATLGTGAAFFGNILALSSITLNTGASLEGRALAINGAVTLDTNQITTLEGVVITGTIWSGSASNLWSGANWSPDLAGATSSTLAPNADVVFSVTGVTPQNQATILDTDVTIASLTFNDPALVSISGANTLTIAATGGDAAITTAIGAGTATINSDLVLTGDSSLISVNNAAGLIINGVVDGTIGLTKAGPGVLTLAGANTYTGATEIVAGTLALNGSIIGNALVSGGTLRGTGSIGGNLVNAAAVNPGTAGAVGTLTIGGNYTQATSGALNLRLASPTEYDRLTISGAAMLSGALNVTYLNGFNAKAGDVFTILTAAGGVDGRFTTFSDEHATGTILALRVIYRENEVLLRFRQGSFANVPPGLTPDQAAVGGGLDQLAASDDDNELIAGLNTLQLAQIPGALSLLSPEEFTTIFTSGLALSQVQVGNLERRMAEVRQGRTGFSDSGYAVTDSRGAQNYDGKSAVSHDGKTMVGHDPKSGKTFIEPEAAVEETNRWGFFISGTGERGDVENTSSARGSTFTTGGVSVGADYRVNEHFVLGAAFGYANTSSDLSRDGSLEINSGKASLYASYFDGGFYLNGIVGGGYSSYKTKRSTIGGMARGDTDGADFNALLGTGYDFRIGAFTVGPTASLRYATVGIDQFTERGALGALRIDEQSQDSLRSAVGIRATYTKRVGRVILVPEVRAQWLHEFASTDSTIDAGFSPGNSFTVHGPNTGRDSLLLEAGISAQLNSRVAIFTYYTGELGRENYTSHSVNGGIRFEF